MAGQLGHSQSSRLGDNLRTSSSSLDADSDEMVHANPERWIGIDLGTSSCSVAVCRNGKVEVIPDVSGKRSTPSVVAFTDKMCLVGQQAQKKQVLRKPEDVLYEVKRLIGRDHYLDDEEDGDDRPGLNEAPGHEGEDDVAGPGRTKQSRSEKKSRKAMQKLGMQPVPGVITAQFNAAEQFKAPDLAPQMEQKLSKAPWGADAEEEEVDDTDVDPRDVDIVQTQVGVSRAKAIQALKNSGGDIINAIMELIT
ncbi:hypothetical protein CBR_g56861 [Chara braunii]|uniref:Uncharacterized protein n=1 Tax=Chara braunii TaxID=69332 RepID=A0A388ME09_CHABU|nr:hypothetical protein CBR_g56861 [Chara braunii]|eukprot:GBG92722.1 hypothetical protein CBR_g56861 [Chara braunii]